MEQTRINVDVENGTAEHREVENLYHKDNRAGRRYFSDEEEKHFLSAV